MSLDFLAAHQGNGQSLTPFEKSAIQHMLFIEEYYDFMLKEARTKSYIETGENLSSSGMLKLYQDYQSLFVEPVIESLYAHPFTDLGNARRLVDSYQNSLRFSTAKGWLVWNGKVWQTKQADAFYLFQQRLGDVESELLAARQRGMDIQLKNCKAYNQLFLTVKKHVHDNGDGRRLSSAEKIARYQPEFAIEQDQLDQDVYLLNVNNGIVYLRTGVLLPHAPEYLMTRIAPVDYLPDAACPTWDKFLSQIMQGNHEMITYLQLLFGYCLTGDISEQIVIIFYGDGANGKSTLVETMHAMMGEYANSASFSIFCDRGTDAKETFAQLDKCRLLTASEARADSIMAEDIIKMMTGSEAIRARALYRDSFTYYPQFKCILSANHEPEIEGQDYAIWRRIRLIPFEVQFKKQQQDKGLLQKLKAELPGILGWAIRGAVQWWADREAGKDGLATPARVVEATQAYKEDMDKLGDFLAAKFLLDPEYRTEQPAIWDAYVQWAKVNGIRQPYSNRTLNSLLRNRGFKLTPSNGKKYYHGLRLREEAVRAMGQTWASRRITPLAPR